MSFESLMALALALPSLGAVLIALSGRYPNLREGITLIISCLLTGVVFALIPTVLAGARPSLDLLDIMPGMPLRFTVEPLGMLFAAVASLLWPINSLYSIGYMRANQEIHQTRFYACFALAIASTMGVALAGNLLTLFVFYEAISLSTYPLVTHQGTSDAIQAGRVYLGILLSTSTGLFLLAILWTQYSAGTLEFRPGGILAGHLHGPQLGMLLFLYIFGIGKAALMPVHRWLPAAMVAPTPVSALLHAVAVVKGGVFAVIKVIAYIFGLALLNAEAGSTYWLLYVASFTLIVASVIALRQDTLKLRLAYSTISQLAYVVLGAALFAPLALMGAALHIAAHAFGKITLFFAAGSIYTAAHKTEISQLNGIGRRMPWTMGAFAVGSLSMIGLPLAAGFISKWYLLEGAFQSQRWLAVGIIIVSTLLNAAYLVPIVYAAFFKPEDNRSLDHGEAPWPIVVALVVTTVLTVLLFLFPGMALRLVKQIVG